MTNKELIAIGEKLYGKRWLAPFAREMGLDRATVKKMSTGERPIPNYIKYAASYLVGMGDGSMRRNMVQAIADHLGVNIMFNGSNS